MRIDTRITLITGIFAAAAFVVAIIAYNTNHPFVYLFALLAGSTFSALAGDAWDQRKKTIAKERRMARRLHPAGKGL